MPCPALPSDGLTSVSATLKLIDCQSQDAVANGFARLFGTSGALSAELTVTLMLFVALFAVGLLLGRANLRLGSVTPRIMLLGVVLTFATSWLAYQSVVWNLLIGAPDQLAGVLLGTHGSATQAFADQLDAVFNILARAAHDAQAANAVAPLTPPPTVAGNAPHPADLLWLAALLLLLGTVGVLIVTRIALAVMLALGPVFIVLALFRGTFGVFEGWFKAALMLAITPLFAVTLGGGTLGLITPMIVNLARSGGQVSLELATSVFLAAFVYLALMILASRAAMLIVGGWRMTGADHAHTAAPALHAPIAERAYAGPTISALNGFEGDSRTRAIVQSVSTASAPVMSETENDSRGVSQSIADRRMISAVASTLPLDGNETPLTPFNRDPRLRPLGQGYRAAKSAQASA